MRILIVTLSALAISSGVFAQNVGIGTNTPDASAKLDVSSTNSGMLVPRVSLISITDVATVPSPTVSLLLYNINAGITGGSGVGFYTWNGSAWVKLITSTDVTSDWSTTGNSGTNPATDFIGTTDAVDLVLRTNNTEAMRVSSTGDVGIGTPTPSAALDVMGPVQIEDGTQGDGEVLTSDANGNATWEVNRSSRTVHTPDPTGGCGTSYAPGASIFSQNITMANAGEVIVSADLIRNYSGRVDLTLYVDGVWRDQTLTYTSSWQWEDAHVNWSGSLGAGNHTIELRNGGYWGNWGCGTTWGSIDTVIFE